MVFFDSRAAGIRITSFARTARDPILPRLILGVVGVALFASFILKAYDDIVFGIVFIGCLTAFLENHTWTVPACKGFEHRFGDLVGCSHMSGPLVRRTWPLALMEFADRALS